MVVHEIEVPCPVCHNTSILVPIRQSLQSTDVQCPLCGFPFTVKIAVKDPEVKG